jgi:LysR family transcriptional regulator, regulator for metE and metH
MNHSRMTPRLSIKHLQILAAFRRTGNLSRIAELLKLTPSAVSRRIDEAEARLGFALFAKASNRVRLTPAGEYILDAAERVLADLERSESVASRLGSDVRHVVRIGMSIYRTFGWLPGFAAHLQGLMPGVQLELTAEADRNERNSLMGGLVDIVLTPLIDEFSGTWRVKLFDDELVALVAPSHALARRGFIKPADIEAQDFFTYSMAVTPGFEYLEFLRPANVRPRRYVIVDTPESAAAVARGGQGLSILSRWAVRSEMEDGRLVALRLTERGVRIAWTALLRLTDGKSSVVHEVALQLRSFFEQDRKKRNARASVPVARRR